MGKGLFGLVVQSGMVVVEGEPVAVMVGMVQPGMVVVEGEPVMVGMVAVEKTPSAGATDASELAQEVTKPCTAAHHQWNYPGQTFGQDFGAP